MGKLTEIHMSTYETEKGSLILPASAVLNMRNALTEEINRRRAYVLTAAEKIHSHLLSDAGKEDRKTLSVLMKGRHTEKFYCVGDFLIHLYERLYPLRTLELGQGELDRLLITRKPDGPNRLQAPKKKDLPLLPLSKTWSWKSDGDEELFITLDPKSRRLIWSIPRNNHAVEYAHASPLYRTMEKMLNSITWTRGTGGVARYTNEHMEENVLDGGEPFQARGWGPLGQIETHVPTRRRKMGMR